MALQGVKVIELAGLAPAPFCGKILHDFGAAVIRIDRIFYPEMDCLGRGKRSLALDLKQKSAIAIVRQLSQQSDVLIEPFRPGVMERLGLGPEQLVGGNPRLVYARLTGYGQSGHLAARAGHDINYLATSGILWMLKRPGQCPVPPVNLLADFAGGGLTCAMGIMAALYERARSGAGQVVDCSMTEGAAYVGSWLYRSRDLAPIWTGEPGTNMLDGGAYYYGCYETADGGHMAVGAIEPVFRARFLQLLALESDSELESVAECDDSGDCALMRQRVADAFRQHSRDHWTRVFADEDACVTAVLSPDEAATLGVAEAAGRPRFLAMEAAVPVGEGPRCEPVPAPHLSRTPATIGAASAAPARGQHSAEILAELGYTWRQVQQLAADGAVELSSTTTTTTTHAPSKL